MSGTQGQLVAPAEAIDQVERKGQSRKRRRTLTWIAFGLLGAIMGSVWAAGFANSSASVGTDVPAPDLVPGTGGASQNSPYAGLATSPEGLTIGFNGRWGNIPSDASMFKVDLSSLPAAQTFYVSVFLTNNPTNWSTLQLKFANVASACPTTQDFSAAGSTQLMVVSGNDAEATFAGLAGGASYCIGVADAMPRASDSAGSFLRRPNTTSVPTMPTFTAVVNRSA